ncbi:MAG: DNA alkylation repair protein, partial [Burkholderiales bacterium]
MSTATKQTPKRLALEAKKALRAAAKHWPPRRADTFFKPGEDVFTLGIGAPRLKQIERKLFNATKKAWSAAEGAEFAEAMLAEKHIEGRTVGLLMLSRFHREYDPNLLARARGWLASRRCDNWALTDLLSTKILAPLLQQYPDLAPRLRD